MSAVWRGYESNFIEICCWTHVKKLPTWLRRVLENRKNVSTSFIDGPLGYFKVPLSSPSSVYKSVQPKLFLLPLNNSCCTLTGPKIAHTKNLARVYTILMWKQHFTFLSATSISAVKRFNRSDFVCSMFPNLFSLMCSIYYIQVFFSHPNYCYDLCWILLKLMKNFWKSKCHIIIWCITVFKETRCANSKFLTGFSLR